LNGRITKYSWFGKFPKDTVVV